MAKSSFLIGDYVFERQSLEGVDEAFKTFYQEEFKNLTDRKRSDTVNRTLLQLIQKQNEPAFLLAGVLDFVERVDREDILHHYTFTSFELWLNQYSGISFEENYAVRAKIVGKKILREDYQGIFPIGMGKIYEGTHYVTAHKSPDLDTTIASFWGWMDAFAARVGNGLHIWNVPGGPPPSQIEIDLIFKDIFGSAIFSHLVKTRLTLSLTGNDLMTQEGLIKRKATDFSNEIDHDRFKNAIVVIDDNGFYLGDWRSLDVDLIRLILSLLNNLLRWFENTIHARLISLFTKEILTVDMIPEFVTQIYGLKLKDCEPAKEYTEKQIGYLDDYLKKILGIEQGFDATFNDFWKAYSVRSLIDFPEMSKILLSIEKANLFDKNGRLIEDRPRIFSYLEKVIRQMQKTLQNVRMHMEQLGLALRIKKEILGLNPTYVTVRSDVEEMRSKMGSYQHLTVLYPDGGKFTPVGIVQAQDLRKAVLGTVSLRDFSNRDEMQIPSYIEVISVIDHHKTDLLTIAPPLAIIGDAQSSNTLVAEQAFIINDRYSLIGLTKEQIEQQIKNIDLKKDFASIRIYSRLLKRKMIADKESSNYISTRRELLEYMHFLYGILDDTDLLTKVSMRDVECVTALLNRMKSLIVKQEVEIITLDDFPRDQNFIKKAVRIILKNEDMYSLYHKVYAFREKEVEKNIHLCIEDQPSALFADTKEQNGCCRVGQTKLFANNIPLLQQNSHKIRDFWQKTAAHINQDKLELDLHIQMISTIVSAEQVYKGESEEYHHKDQIWIWVPPNDLAIEHLKRFLNAFKDCPQLKSDGLEVEFLGDNADLLSQVFSESFIKIPHKKSNESIPIAVLYHKAGILNSRKAMISPYLPDLVI